MPGPGGTYRLVPSIKIPPLLLDAVEISTLVTGLIVLEAGSEDTAVTAVRAKLQQLLPPTMRRRAVATAQATQVITPMVGPADWKLLGVLAEAVAQRQHLRFLYTDQHGRLSERDVCPYRHVLREGTWYLVAYETRRTDWRLFRLDRIQDASPQRAPISDPVPDFPGTSIQEWLSTDFGRLPPHGN